MREWCMVAKYMYSLVLGMCGEQFLYSNLGLYTVLIDPRLFMISVLHGRNKLFGGCMVRPPAVTWASRLL